MHCYRVICKDDRGLYCYPTRALFNYRGALYYASGVAKTRAALVIKEVQ